MLPAGVLIEAPEAAADQAANLSRAYRVNLTMLAAMALLTGGFLVFSAQALSVVRRRTEFAFLRALGLARRSLFAWLLAEGALVGLAGGVVGVVLGHGLAWGALALLGGDLGAGYFSGLKPQLQFQPQVTAVYVAARRAGRHRRRLAAGARGGDGLAGPGLEGRRRGGAARRPRPSVARPRRCCWPAWPPAAIPPLDGLPVGGYLAVAFLLAGSVMLLPALAAGIARLLPQRGPVPARLAAARLGAAPGHAVVAAAGVLTSVALAAAMAIMVASFRDSVDQWLSQILPADLYLRAGQAKTSAYLDEALQARIAAVPGVDRSQLHPPRQPAPGRRRSAGGPDRPAAGGRRQRPAAGRRGAARRRSRRSGSPRRCRTSTAGDPASRSTLPLAGSAVSLHVAGVWRDYARQTGAVMIDLADYRRLTGDRLVNDAAI